MSTKTKRMSAEEKRNAILGVYHSTKEVYTEKEIIALAAKAGVNQNTWVGCYGIIVLFALYLYLFDGGIILLSGIELLRMLCVGVFWFSTIYKIKWRWW